LAVEHEGVVRPLGVVEHLGERRGPSPNHHDPVGGSGLVSQVRAKLLAFELADGSCLQDHVGDEFGGFVVEGGATWLLMAMVHLDSAGVEGEGRRPRRGLGLADQVRSGG